MSSIDQNLMKLTPVSTGMALSEVLTAERWQALQDIVAALARGENIRDGVNLRKKSGSTWVLLSGEKGGGEANAAEPALDFALYNASDEDSLKIGVRFGMTACYILADGVTPWPADYNNPESEYVYEFTVSSSGVAWVRFTNDISGEFNKVSAIDMGHGAEVPSSTETLGYLPVGTWSVTEGVLTIITKRGIGSQYYNLCGPTHAYGPL